LCAETIASSKAAAYAPFCFHAEGAARHHHGPALPVPPRRASHGGASGRLHRPV